jgi:hypothetical protein
MKKFIAGLVLGLSFAVAPAIAEWGWGDMDLLKKIVVALDRTAASNEQQAQALNRLANVLEHACPAPAEKPSQR